MVEFGLTDFTTLFFPRFKLFPQFLNLFAQFLHFIVQTADVGVQFFRSRIQAGLRGAGLADTGLATPKLPRPSGLAGFR